MFLAKSLKIGTHSIFGIYIILQLTQYFEQNLGVSQPAEHWNCRKLKNIGTGKYFVLDFHSNHGLFGKNLHDQKFLLNWIYCFRAKSP